MSVSVLYMSMSLDEYVAGPNDELSNPFGADGRRLPDCGSSLRTVSSAVRAGRRVVRRMECDTGGHTHPLPRTSLSRSTCSVSCCELDPRMGWVFSGVRPPKTPVPAQPAARAAGSPQVWL